jgi:hypothetical protein
MPTRVKSVRGTSLDEVPSDNTLVYQDQTLGKQKETLCVLVPE